MSQQQPAIFSVSQITKGIKSLLESEFESISLHGEISNFKKHSSGHLYFTLKDEKAQISAVMFRGSTMNMFFSPRDGMEVVCRGSISVYEPRGNYQILVKEMLPKGEGALRVAFEKLKKQLFDEGLFDEDQKQPIPVFPSTIAIITSPTGAAIRDMLVILRRKNPSVKILLLPVQVQGTLAKGQIAEAIDTCNRYGDIDTIIVGRGGGSLEDLWAFNEESVARAIAGSQIPVISAVGHEVDFTIADFVADARAATPSVAAEMAVQDRSEMIAAMKDISKTLDKLVGAKLEGQRERLRSISRERVFASMNSHLRSYQQLIDEQADRLRQSTQHYFQNTRHNLILLKSKLEAHDSERILRKGYAILRKNDSVIRSVEDVTSGDDIQAELHDGSLELRLKGTSSHNG